jgi:hypothetical protein
VPGETRLLGEMVSDDPACPPEERVRVEGFRDNAIPDDEAVTATDKLPAKPFRLETVSVTEPDELEGILIEDGLAARAKSGGRVTVTEIVTEWDNDPEAPVTLAEKVPVGVEETVDTVNVTVPDPPEDRVTELEPSEAVALDVDIDEVRLMAPTKPERLVRVIVDVPEDPWTMASVTWLDEIAKSEAGGGEVTVKIKMTECERLPDVPVTVTV